MQWLSLPNEYRLRSDSKSPMELADKVLDIILNHRYDGAFDIGDYNINDYYTYIKGYSFEQKKE